MHTINNYIFFRKGILSFFLTLVLQISFAQNFGETLKLAEQGDKEAQYLAGKMYFDGKIIEQDYENAYQWFLKSAEQGHAIAQYNLGAMYYGGYHNEEKDQNSDREVRIIEAGYAIDQKMYYGGYYSEEKDQKAYNWFLKSAEKGNSDAQFSLGIMCVVDRNYQEAYEWFLKSAEQENSIAQYNLGHMYDNGIYVLKSPTRAFEWYLKSASQGFSDAQYEVGSRYFYAEGTPITSANKNKSVYWIKKAYYENENKKAKWFWEEHELWRYDEEQSSK